MRTLATAWYCTSCLPPLAPWQKHFETQGALQLITTACDVHTIINYAHARIHTSFSDMHALLYCVFCIVQAEWLCKRTIIHHHHSSISFIIIVISHSPLHTHRIIVGAPNGTAAGSPVDNTGLIYSCPVNPGQCSGLMGSGTGSDRRLFDTAGKASKFILQHHPFLAPSSL